MPAVARIMKHPLRFAALLALGLGLLLSWPGPAQEVDPLSSLFTDSVRVEVVNVDVFVTDKQGKPVKGLGRDDFEVLVDGEPVEVSNFHVGEARTRRSVRPGAAAARRASRPRRRQPASRRSPPISSSCW